MRLSFVSRSRLGIVLIKDLTAGKPHEMDAVFKLISILYSTPKFHAKFDSNSDY